MRTAMMQSWVLLFFFWVGFLAGDAEPTKHNKSVLKILGAVLVLLTCVILGMWLGAE